MLFEWLCLYLLYECGLVAGLEVCINYLNESECKWCGSVDLCILIKVEMCCCSVLPIGADEVA